VQIERIDVEPKRTAARMTLDAQIARDDGSAGLALRFVDLTADEQARLAEILAVLPTICEARDSAEGIFVSEMLERIAG